MNARYEEMVETTAEILANNAHDSLEYGDGDEYRHDARDLLDALGIPALLERAGE